MNSPLILGSIVTGLVAIIGAWIKRPREATLERGANPYGHGFSFSGSSGKPGRI